MPKQRKHKHSAPGQLVQINGRNMHVFSAGEGANTFIFLAGSGTRYPTTDFEPLWSILAKSNKIAVVERAGYGWSDISDNAPRDIDTLLAETREALRQAQIAPPYILVPHSMSGLETLYWAQNHREEVRAIIGLDSTHPEYYDNAEVQLGIVKIMAKLGIITSDMLNEGLCIYKNSDIVKAKPFPADVPAYIFISDGKFARPAKCKNWGELLAAHAQQFTNGKHMFTDCGHYVHHHKAKEIAAEIETFIAAITP
ncbi:MAG: alpha/beta hydrolase [Oscillospiraceae bacterium]|nr:alpha/beta hydrolase [Oscillospiraceae bacterium]